MSNMVLRDASASKNAIFQDENITRGDKIELLGAMPAMI